MRVLAVDTTTERGSVALVSDQGVLAEVRVRSAAGHSRWLLGAVDALLRGLEVEARQLDAFAVTTGPGSFTGLRVGLSSVQGLALASGKPCVGVSALDVLALSGARSGARPAALVALMNAFRGEVYWALYDAEGVRQAEPRVGPLEAVLAECPGRAAFVGDAVDGARSRIQAEVREASFPDVDLHLAVPLGRTALARLAAGETVLPGQLRPLYLRGVDIRAPRPGDDRARRA